MIQVYKTSNNNYDINGDMAIQPINAILMNTGINTIPSIEMDIPYDPYGAWEYVINNSIIKCPTPWGEDLFRVYDSSKDDDSYTVYAKQVFSDLSNIVAKDYNNDDICIVATGIATGQQAIDKLFANTNFKGHSNILKTDNVRWERKTITQALLSDDDNSFVKRWGGELFVNNFDIYMNDRIGEDNGVRISYGKNLDSIEQTIKTDGTVTRIIPEGANGLRLIGKTPWVDSQYINSYPIIYERVVNFDNVKVKEKPDDTEGFATEDLARQELIRLSNLMFSQQHIDTPSVNIKVSMVDVRDSVEYKMLGYSGIEKIGLGDTVTCRHYKLGIETKARVISYKWDVSTEKFIEIEIGDTQLNFFDKQTDLNNKVSNVINSNGNLKAESMQGFLDATNTKIRATKSIAQNQHVRAIEFEDTDTASPTYGSTLVGTEGVMVADSLDTNGNWDYKSALTAKGLVAEKLYGKVVAGANSYIDLEKGDFKLGGKAEHTPNYSRYYNDNGDYLEIKNNNMEFYFKDGSRTWVSIFTGTGYEVFLDKPMKLDEDDTNNYAYKYEETLTLDIPPEFLAKFENLQGGESVITNLKFNYYTIPIETSAMLGINNDKFQLTVEIRAYSIKVFTDDNRIAINNSLSDLKCSFDVAYTYYA